ncbi:ABC transporter substrate-binding protein [Ensifer adhaerens]|uniref:ABC transporter substrate-binding protein n=1 Tax=Ensifer adhaerens TaxID=106592 RepID=UPI001CBD6B5C|nr:ABC transporter substrate-binding protein [Ensifer adhaerens]MBZ7924247.1 ABC transporter substrate-binding protein [Ensifer adhaerens]UAX96499.1 ABC transporter substrate-binding protein [Ensifer adhaerens]UAY04157.1 ABC transporter substrate-binding protein [Ensifer adhaerens]UAY12143.1 ABC transporter substrate-binding protein [Ensifer adhaerens]
MKTILAAGVTGVLLTATPTLADIAVCVTVSATGPAASLGAPQQATVSLLPTEVAGQKIKYITFDDASDPTVATRNVRKCIEEQGADILVGSSPTPPTIAIAGVAGETETPLLALSPVTLPEKAEHWTFRLSQPVQLMAAALIEHMKANDVKTLGFIGYSDGYGELWLDVITRMLDGTGISLGPVERYARTDTSVTGQALKLVAAAPDAVLVAGSGTPAALPNLALAERGYTGQIYHTHGSASVDFLRVAGATADGTILPVGPVMVAAQLPDDHPSKTLGTKYTVDYTAQHGENTLSPFGAYMFDAGQLIQAAVPVALKTASPGTHDFRMALRNALENINNVVGVNGTYSMSPEDHDGRDQRSRVLVKVQDGAWEYLH